MKEYIKYGIAFFILGSILVLNASYHLINGTSFISFFITGLSGCLSLCSGLVHMIDFFREFKIVRKRSK